MNIRKQRLLDSLQVQQLFRDIEDEEAWIREKEPVAASTNRGMTDSFCFLYVFSHLIFCNFHFISVILNYALVVKYLIKQLIGYL
jgi:hypothetical protein